MRGYDWNKNGKRDTFDRFMDMKVMSEVSKKIDDTPNCPLKNTPPICDEKSQSQRSPQSNGLVIFKSILAIGLVVGAFAICLSGAIGKLGMGLLLIGAAFGGYFILK